jgi:hypothetical protein
MDLLSARRRSQCGLAPFYPASHNDWRISPTDAEIEGYVRFFQLLLAQLQARPVAR